MVEELLRPDRREAGRKEAPRELRECRRSDPAHRGRAREERRAVEDRPEGDRSSGGGQREEVEWPSREGSRRHEEEHCRSRGRREGDRGRREEEERCRSQEEEERRESRAGEERRSRRGQSLEEGSEDLGRAEEEGHESRGSRPGIGRREEHLREGEQAGVHQACSDHHHDGQGHEGSRVGRQQDRGSVWEEDGPSQLANEEAGEKKETS